MKPRGLKIEERVFLINNYQATKSFTTVKRLWNKKFKRRVCPSRNALEEELAKFNATGSVADKPPKQRPEIMKRILSVPKVKELIEHDPSLSIRRLSVLADISYSLTRTILKQDLKLKPFKLQNIFELEPSDWPRRMEFAKFFLDLPENALDCFIFSDESIFLLKQKVNRQNTRLWLSSKPDDLIELPLFDEQVMVWCGMSAHKVYGPYFFETNVNQHNYLDMLKDFFWEKHRKVQGYSQFYFQQDGARPHIANDVQSWLTERFGDRFINKKMWPPRSPDLNPCDYFLWGYLKSKVYYPAPQTLDELKSNISEEIKKINSDMLKSSILSLRKRCQFLLDNGGAQYKK